MIDETAGPEGQGTAKDAPTDDFVEKATVDAPEQRLHILAFEFWNALKKEQTFPEFAALTPEGLDPFKSNSLLLDLSKPDQYIVRFIGERISMLLDAPVRQFDNLIHFPKSGFARELVGQLEYEAGNYRAAEFEFSEDTVVSRGVFLPFYGAGDKVQFVLVVANFTRLKPEELDINLFADDKKLNEDRDPAPHQAAKPDDEEFDGTSGDTGDKTDKIAGEIARAVSDSFASRLQQTSNAAPTAIRSDTLSRRRLYALLGDAMALYKEAQENPEAYKELLKDRGISAQARAPFTPVLKLVFGPYFDKTRLTEYASALSHAFALDVDAQDVAAFLQNFPGGIKGCVRAERDRRRGIIGHASNALQEKAMETVQALPAIPLEAAHTDGEFSLVLTRRTSNGSLEPVSIVDVADNTLDSIIRSVARNAQGSDRT